MKVGQQHVDRPKPASRRDENIGLGGEFANFAMRGETGLENAQAGGADRHHAPALGPGRVDPRGGRCRDLPPFGMHAMLGDVVDRHRQEGAGPDMERDLGDGDTGVLQRRRQFRREMKPGRRRRDRARLRREHGLIVLVVSRCAAVGTADIGRQRHAAMGGKARLDRRRVERVTAVRIDKGDAHLSTLAASANACGKAGAEKNDIIGPAFACRLGEHLPVGPALMLVKGDADPGLAPPAGKPRRDHPRIVDHKHIPRPQKRRQVTHDPVVDGIALEIEKPCRMARSRRFRGNRLGRQFIIEI